MCWGKAFKIIMMMIRDDQVDDYLKRIKSNLLLLFSDFIAKLALILLLYSTFLQSFRVFQITIIRTVLELKFALGLMFLARNEIIQ